VRLYVIGSHGECRGDGLKNAELISHGIEHFFVRHIQFLASEIFTIEKTRMRSDSDSPLHRRGDRGVHRI
jgi:hypothetical protein